MFEVIKQSESTAARRRMYFKVYDSADAVSGKVFTTTGVKMYLSKNGATAVASAADIVAVDTTNEPGKYYIELAATECDTIGQIAAELPAATGRLAAAAQATVVSYDPYADGASTSTIATAVAGAVLVTPANKLATASDGSIQLSAADEANVAKLDATISSRASATALAAGVTLTTGEHSALIAALLGSVIETNGGVTMTVQKALQIGAAGAVGKRGGITPGTGTQTVTIRSVTDGQVLATITGDENGNTTTVVLTVP